MGVTEAQGAEVIALLSAVVTATGWGAVVATFLLSLVGTVLALRPHD